MNWDSRKQGNGFILHRIAGQREDGPRLVPVKTDHTMFDGRTAGHRLKTLKQLGENGCRWPYDCVNGIRFCGRQKLSWSSYCAKHVSFSLGRYLQRRKRMLPDARSS